MPRGRTAQPFWERYVESPSGCWEWTGSRIPHGYGSLGRNGRTILAHRHAWELSRGPIPEGMHVLHSCDNPPCINPDHLRLGTHAENMAEKAAKGRASRWRSEITHCKWGHEYTPENTGSNGTARGTSRRCKACRRRTPVDIDYST